MQEPTEKLKKAQDAAKARMDALPVVAKPVAHKAVASLGVTASPKAYKPEVRVKKPALKESSAGKPADGALVRKPRRLKDATAMGKLMHRSVSGLGLAKGAVMSRVLAQWPQICPMFAPWSVPLDVKGGALRVAVAHDSIKRELLMHAPQLVATVNQLLGYEGVQRLVPVVQSLPTARPKQTFVPPQAAVSLDTATTACESVRDDELKGALARLGRWLMQPETKKG